MTVFHHMIDDEAICYWKVSERIFIYGQYNIIINPIMFMTSVWTCCDLNLINICAVHIKSISNPSPY